MAKKFVIHLDIRIDFGKHTAKQSVRYAPGKFHETTIKKMVAANAEALYDLAIIDIHNSYTKDGVAADVGEDESDGG